MHIDQKWPNSLKIVPSGVDNCRKLPFGGRAMRDSRVRLPWEENARSRHQRLFEENVRKTGKGVVVDKSGAFAPTYPQ